MLRIFNVVVLVFVAIAGLTSLSAWAATPDEILAATKTDAKNENPSFQGFSATRGENFFKQTHGHEWSCASCHTENPTQAGKHAKSGKIIQALAPSANTERFTDPAKVAKWFKRNCNDVLERACTPQEKGDVLAYLLTIKR